MKCSKYPTVKDRLEDFNFIIEMYALSDDSKLTNDGIELKRLIIKHVDEFYEKYGDKI
jgi:hypothetical protein